MWIAQAHDGDVSAARNRRPVRSPAGELPVNNAAATGSVELHLFETGVNAAGISRDFGSLGLQNSTGLPVTPLFI
jgi:hypothetical protein